MAIMKLGLSLVILGILYKRMLDREHPAQISKKQALVPVLLGILSTGISFGIFLGFAVLILKSGFSLQTVIFCCAPLSLPLSRRGFRRSWQSC